MTFNKTEPVFLSAHVVLELLYSAPIYDNINLITFVLVL